MNNLLRNYSSAHRCRERYNGSMRRSNDERLARCARECRFADLCRHKLSLLVPRRAGQHPARKRLGSRLPHPCGRVPSVSTAGRITPGPACAR